MYVLTSRRRETGQVQSRDADGLQGVTLDWRSSIEATN
jgi:hypothetical protein